MSGLCAAVGVRFGTYSANYADVSGYVAQAELWTSGCLFRPVPLQLWASWPNAAEIGSALGFRPGPISGTEVPFYPPGMPLLMAAAQHVVGELGPYLVAPIFAGILVFVTFLLGRSANGSLAGLAAATLVAVSPITLLHTVQAMSDVPATACWACGWYLALRRGGEVAAAATGALVALAVSIRPNLAPLAVVPLSLILTRDVREAPRRWRWRRAWTFAAVASVGPLLVWWTQLALYGSPFESGYRGWQSFFSAASIPANGRNYWRMWLDVYGVLPLVGLAAPLLMLASGIRKLGPNGSWAVVVSASALIVLNVALYLPYLPVDHWPFLRFLLPANVAMFVLFGVVLASVTRFAWDWPKARVAALVLPLAVGVVAFRRTDLVRYSLEEWRAHQTIPMMGNYLSETLHQNAVALSFAHSGAIAHYTGANVVRLDLVDPETLDLVVADLEKFGLEPVLILDGFLEQPRFGDRFKGSALSQLDWPPRAVATSVSTITYWVVSDRARHIAGEQWPVDHLRPSN